MVPGSVKHYIYYGGGDYGYQLIRGDEKQYQRINNKGVYNYAGPCPGNGECSCYAPPYNCIDGEHGIPCHDAPTDELPNRVRCYKVWLLYYYKWGC